MQNCHCDTCREGGAHHMAKLGEDTKGTPRKQKLIFLLLLLFLPLFFFLFNFF